MNAFAVDWDVDTENELAAIYLAASDPAAVTRAQARADRLLAGDPIGNGRWLSEGLYHLVVFPLVVYYSLDAGRRHVQVTWVRYAP
jgi:hypothetical protein